MTEFSVLDLISVREGTTVAEAFADTAALAQTAEKAGFKRFWIAEHHGTPGIAGGATAVAIAHIGHATSTIRVGSGGIMLPNHNPYVIAEQFGALDAMFPGRVDLGLGRAAGSTPVLGQALRKDLARAAEYFPQDVLELRALLTGDVDLPIMASPGLGAKVEMWMLGSSLFGAQLAAQLGMPYAFASHFAPKLLDQALETYRTQFQPSAYLDKPHVMAGMTVVAAETDREAQTLASSLEQTFVSLRMGGELGKLPPPIANYRDQIPEVAQRMLNKLDTASAVGSPATVRDSIERFVDRTKADEIVFAGAVFDPAARRHSLELAMERISG